MKVNKVQVYKDSNGKLHETEKTYVLAEYEIWITGMRETVNLLHKHINGEDPLILFEFIKTLGRKAIEMGPKFEEEANSKNELIKKFQKYKFDSLSDKFATDGPERKTKKEVWLDIDVNNL